MPSSLFLRVELILIRALSGVQQVWMLMVKSKVRMMNCRPNFIKHQQAWQIAGEEEPSQSQSC